MPKPTPSDLEATQVFHAAQAASAMVPDDDTPVELEEDAIIGQASVAHEPRPVTEVAVEHRRVVISEVASEELQDAVSGPRAPESQSVEGAPARRFAPRGARRERRISEPTLVMRDRRQLEEIRRQLLADQALLTRSRSVWMWGSLAVLGFTLITLLVVVIVRQERSAVTAPPDTSLRRGAPASGESPMGKDVVGRPSVLSAPAPVAAPAASGKPDYGDRPVDLTELPLERARKK